MKNQMMKGIVAAAVVAALGFAPVQAQGPGGQGQGARGGGGFQRGGIGPFGMGEFGLVMRPDVQKDLNLTEEQKKKLGDLRGTMGRNGQRRGGGAGGAGGSDGGPRGGAGGGRGGEADVNEMRARMEARRAEARKALGEILTPAQVTRLDEISVQLRGNRAILDPDVQRKVEFGSTQQTKLQDLMSKQRDANQQIRQKVRDGELDREGARKAMENNEKILDTELGKLLTTSQAAKLKALGGKPFTADPQFEGRGRGAGGGGGAGRGGAGR